MTELGLAEMILGRCCPPQPGPHYPHGHRFGWLLLAVPSNEWDRTVSDFWDHIDGRTAGYFAIKSVVSEWLGADPNPWQLYSL